MCLAIPGRIVETFETHNLRFARVDFGGTIKKACLEHVPEAVVGDYVLVHVGFALSVIDAEEAARTYELLRELGQLDELDAPETGP